jgi:hypothetical protein
VPLLVRVAVKLEAARAASGAAFLLLPPLPGVAATATATPAHTGMPNGTPASGSLHLQRRFANLLQASSSQRLQRNF